MLMTAKLTWWSDGHVLRAPVLLTTPDLRDILLTALDYDEERVGFICRAVEENGAYALDSESGDSTALIEKILHC